MEKIWNGAARFNAGDAHRLRSLLSRLAREGQSPDALFITCADLRVVPRVITGSNPGDLFVMRNVGSRVPRYYTRIGGNIEFSVAAALEYTLDALKVRDIIVCGHSDCGAMKAILQQDVLDASHLQRWLLHAGSAFGELHMANAPDANLPTHDQLAQSNVLQQLENLGAYSFAADAVRAGAMRLSGWFFDIARAEVRVYDEQRNRFCRIEELTYTPYFTQQSNPRFAAQESIMDGRTYHA